MSLLRTIVVITMVLGMQYTTFAATYRAPVTLAIGQDTWVRDGSSKAEGTDALLRLHNAQPSAVLLGINAADVQAAAAGDQIHTAYIELYVQASDAWGARGRHVDLHALDQGWDESASWECPSDDDGQQLNKVSCAIGWDLPAAANDASRIARTVARTAVTGWTRIDISSDIARWQSAGSSLNWVVLKRYAGKRGLWDINSREGVFAPKLVLGFEPPAEVLNHDIALVRDAYVDQSVPYTTFVGSDTLDLGKKGRYSILLDPDWSTIAAAGQERSIRKVYLALEVESAAQMGAEATMYVHGIAAPWINVSWACTDVDFAGGCAISWLNNVPEYQSTPITSIVIQASPGVPESLLVDITQAALQELDAPGALNNGLYLRLDETVAGAQISLYSGTSDFPTRLVVEYEPTPPYLASAYITVADGGSVFVDDPTSSYHGIRLQVPAGALVTDTVVYINAVDDQRAWQLTPYGWPVTDLPLEIGLESGGFAVPVELQVPYNAAYVAPYSEDSIVGFAATQATNDTVWTVQTKTSQDLENNILVAHIENPGFYWAGIPLHGRPHPDLRFGAPALTYATQPVAYTDDFEDGWFNPYIWFHVGQSHVGGIVEESGGKLVMDTGANVPQDQYDLAVQQQVYAYVPEHSETYAITVSGHFDEVSEGRYTFGVNFFGYAAGNIDYVETGSYELQILEGSEIRSSLTALNSGSSSVSVSQIPFLSLKELELTFRLSYDGATGLMRASVEPFGLEVTVANAVEQAPRYLSLVNLASTPGAQGYRRSRFLVEEVSLVFAESGQYQVDVTPFRFQGTLYSLEATPFVLFDERTLQVDTSQGFPPQLGLTQNFTPIVADGTAVSIYPFGDFNVALLDLGPEDMYTVITQWEYGDFTNIGIVPDAILPAVYRAQRYGVDYATNLVPNNPPVVVSDVPALWLGGTTAHLSAEASSDLDSTPGTNDDIVGFSWYLDADHDGMVSAADISLQVLADSHTDRYASITLDPALVAQGDQHILAVASDRFGAVSTQGHWIYNRHVNAAPIAAASPVLEPYYGVTAPTGLHLVLDGSASLDSDSAYSNDDIVEFDWFYDSNNNGLLDVGDLHLEESGAFYVPGRLSRDERITIRADWLSEGTILLRVRDRYGAEDIASVSLLKLDLVLAAQHIESRLLALYGGPETYELYATELAWASDLVQQISSGNTNAAIGVLDLLQPILQEPNVCPSASVCYNSNQHLLALLPQYRQTGWDFDGLLADPQSYLSVEDGNLAVQGNWMNPDLIADGWIDILRGYSWGNDASRRYELPVSTEAVTAAISLIDDGQGNADNTHTLYVRWETWGGVQYEQSRSLVWQTVDRQPPVIAILSPPDGYNTTSQQLPLIGQVTDNNYIQEVILHLQGPNSFVEGGIEDRMDPDGSFYVPIGLDPFLLEYPAIHTATVIATDAHGNQRSRSITLGFWDTLPPPAPVTAAILTPADGLSVRTGLVYVSTGAYTDSQDPLQSHSLRISGVDRSSELLDLPTGFSGWLWLGAEGTYNLHYSLTTSNGTTAQAFSTAYVDQTPPSIGQLYPFAQAVSDPYVPLQVSVLDSVSAIDQLDFAFQNPGYVCSQGSCQTVVVAADQAEMQHEAALFDGQYTWSVAVFDFAGNVTYSAPLAFTVDTITPVFSLQTTAQSHQQGDQLFVDQTIDSLIVDASDTGAGIASITVTDHLGESYGPAQTSQVAYPVTQLPLNVQVEVLDLAGNSAATAVSIVLDQSGPTVTSAIVGPQYDDGSKLWTSEEHSRIGLWANDAGAGVQRILYNNSNNMYVAPLKTYGQPFQNYGNNRQKYISAQATDILGNAGNLLEYTVWVDNSAPTLYPVFAGQFGHAPSYGGETSYVVGLQSTISLYTEDSGSGLGSASYQIETYAGTVLHSGGDELITFGGLLPGLYRLRLSASDNVQNISSYSVLILVDSAGPDVSIQLQGPQYATGGTLYVDNSTQFDILATDAGGAVTETWYRLDGGNWQVGTQLLAAEAGSEGSHILEAIAFDDAANISALATLAFVLDNAAPVVTFTLSGTYYTAVANTWLGSDSTVTASVTDAAAGVTQTIWSWQGAATATTTAPGVLTFAELPVDNGAVTASVYAWDGLQHAVAATAAWQADLLAPSMTTTITPLAGRDGVLYVAPGSVLSAAVTDTDSGLAGWFAATGTQYSAALAATEVIQPFAGYFSDTLVLQTYAIDNVGNSTMPATASITVDGIAPDVQFFASGITYQDQLGQLWALDGASIDATVTDAGVDGSVAAFQYGGTDAAMPLVLSGAGLHSIDYQATDALSNQATGQGAVRVDAAAPAVSLIDLADGDVIRQPNVNVGFWAADDLPVQAYVNGQPATKYQDGSFWKEIALSPGDNPIEVTAADALGQTSTLAISVYRSVLNMQVLEPAQNTVTTATGILVTGYVNPATGPEVLVAGVSVSLDAAGSFSTTVPLQSGATNNIVVAASYQGELSTETRRVYQGIDAPEDTDPAIITVLQPGQGAAVAGPQVDVIFRANEPITGTVNGVDFSQLPDGRYLATVTLVEGPRVIVIHGYDAVGNRTERQIDVLADNAAPLLIIYAPAPGAVTQASPVTVTGMVQDSTLGYLTVNNQDVLLTGNHFSHAVALSPGINYLQFQAGDAVGFQTAASQQITLDAAVPLIAWVSPESGADVTEYTWVELHIESDEQLSRVTVDNQDLYDIGNDRYANYIYLPVGSHSMVAQAINIAGGFARVERQVLVRYPANEAMYVTNVTPATGAQGISNIDWVELHFSAPVSMPSLIENLRMSSSNGVTLNVGFGLLGDRIVTIGSYDGWPEGEEVVITVPAGVESTYSQPTDRDFTTYFAVQPAMTIAQVVVFDENMIPVEQGTVTVKDNRGNVLGEADITLAGNARVELGHGFEGEVKVHFHGLNNFDRVVKKLVRAGERNSIYIVAPDSTTDQGRFIIKPGQWVSAKGSQLEFKFDDYPIGENGQPVHVIQVRELPRNGWPDVRDSDVRPTRLWGVANRWISLAPNKKLAIRTSGISVDQDLRVVGVLATNLELNFAGPGVKSGTGEFEFILKDIRELSEFGYAVVTQKTLSKLTADNTLSSTFSGAPQMNHLVTTARKRVSIANTTFLGGGFSESNSVGAEFLENYNTYQFFVERPCNPSDYEFRRIVDDDSVTSQFYTNDNEKTLVYEGPVDLSVFGLFVDDISAEIRPDCPPMQGVVIETWVDDNINTITDRNGQGGFAIPTLLDNGISATVLLPLPTYQLPLYRIPLGILADDKPGDYLNVTTTKSHIGLSVPVQVVTSFYSVDTTFVNLAYPGLYTNYFRSGGIENLNTTQYYDFESYLFGDSGMLDYQVYRNGFDTSHSGNLLKNALSEMVVPLAGDKTFFNGLKDSLIVEVQGDFEPGTEWMVCREDGTYNVFELPEVGYTRFREPIVNLSGYGAQEYETQNIGVVAYDKGSVVGIVQESNTIKINLDSGATETCIPGNPLRAKKNSISSVIVLDETGQRFDKSASNRAIPSRYKVVTFNREFGWLGITDVKPFSGALTSAVPRMYPSVVDVDVQRGVSPINSGNLYTTHVGPGGIMDVTDKFIRIDVGWHGLDNELDVVDIPNQIGNLWAWVVRDGDRLERLEIQPGQHTEIFNTESHGLLAESDYAFYVQAGDHPVYGHWNQDNWLQAGLVPRASHSVDNINYRFGGNRGLVQQGQIVDRVWNQEEVRSHFPFDVTVDTSTGKEIYRPVLLKPLRMTMLDRKMTENDYKSKLIDHDHSVQKESEKLGPPYAALEQELVEYLAEFDLPLESSIEDYRQKYSPRSCFTEKEADLYFPKPDTSYTYFDIVANNVPSNIRHGLVPICRAVSTWSTRDIGSVGVFADSQPKSNGSCPVGYTEVRGLCGRDLSGEFVDSDATISPDDSNIFITWDDTLSEWALVDDTELYSSINPNHQYELRLSNCDETQGSPCSYTVNVDAGTQQITIAIDGNIFSQLTAQDLQYIDLVLAGDLMNPIWSFEMSVELNYELVDSRGQTTKLAMAQDGTNRNRDYFVKLEAPGTTGELIAAVIEIIDPITGLPEVKGVEYPSSQVAVLMQRVSDDQASPDYNLYAIADNRPLVFTPNKTIEVTAPTNAIIVGDDVYTEAVVRTCRESDLFCDPVRAIAKGLQEIEFEFTKVVENQWNALVRDPRVHVDIGHDCPGSDFENCATKYYGADTFEIHWDDPALASPADTLVRARFTGLSSEIETEWQFNIFSEDLEFVRQYNRGNPVQTTEERVLLREIDTGLTASSIPGGSQPYATYQLFRARADIPNPYTVGNGKEVPGNPYRSTGLITMNFFDNDFELRQAFGILKLEQTIKSVISQEYWDHYPYKYNYRYIECIKHDDMSKGNDTRCGPQSNTREMPTVAHIVQAVYTASYVKESGARCDGSCGLMLASNYEDDNFTIYNDTGYGFLEDSFNAIWTALLASENVGEFDENYLSDKEYKAHVQSIWRNPERQELQLSGVINSAHQFGVGIDFSQKNSFTNVGIGRRAYDPANKRIIPFHFCALAQAAWTAGATDQVIIERRSKELVLWDGDKKIWDRDPNTGEGLINTGCVGELIQKLDQCISGGDSAASCSPTHVHAALPQQ